MFRIPIHSEQLSTSANGERKPRDEILISALLIILGVMVHCGNLRDGILREEVTFTAMFLSARRASRLTVVDYCERQRASAGAYQRVCVYFVQVFRLWSCRDSCAGGCHLKLPGWPNRTVVLIGHF